MNHIISIEQFSRRNLESIFELTDKLLVFQYRTSRSQLLLKGKLLASLFYEPSSRTSNSFKSAMYRLGGNVIGFDGIEASSVSKGETLADTIKTFSQYSDVIVLRHPSEGSASLASKVSEVPIINAGDGANEHPTQTLLDLYTIHKLIHEIDGLKIGFIGDNKYSRTVHSLTKALSLYEGITIYHHSPEGLELPSRYVDRNIECYRGYDLDFMFDTCDVIYVTRIQKERFRDLIEYKRVKGAYQITKDLASKYSNTQILHPLPRVDEIHPDVDQLHNAKYFDQTRNGMLIRQALLIYSIKKTLKLEELR